MANPVLAPQAHKTIDSRASAPSTRTAASHTTTSTGKDTSVERETRPDGLSLIRASLTGRCISEQAQEILLQSWRKGTQKQYETCLQKWLSFCGERHSDPLQPTIDQVIDFLTHLFISGIGYSAMNTARCALSTFVILEGNISVGSHPLVKRFLKAVYQCRPAFPLYTKFEGLTKFARFTVGNINLKISYVMFPCNRPKKSVSTLNESRSYVKRT